MLSGKENTLFQRDFWQNNSYWRTIFQKTAQETLAEYKMEHYPTRIDSLLTLVTVAKSSILNMTGVLKPRLVTKANGNRDH